MIQLRNSSFYKNLFETLAPGVGIKEEGVALTYVKVGGETMVEIGAAGGRFAGIAIARNLPPEIYPLVESGVVPPSATGTLTRAPIPGKLLVTVAGAALTQVAGAPAAGEVQVVGDTYTVNTADVGNKITFQYMYLLTVKEAASIIGEAQPGQLAANALGTIAVIKQGEVATSFFDAAQDWSTTTYAKIADGGVFTPATAATGLPGVIVKNSPNAGNPFLVLEVNVG